jgi:hypothetical protein
MVPNPRAPWSAWQSEDVYDTDDQAPARLSRFGLVRAGENRIVLIVVVGVLVGVLALAAVLGYVVFHALNSTERTTVGAGEVGAVQVVGSGQSEVAGVRRGAVGPR